MAPIKVKKRPSIRAKAIASSSAHQSNSTETRSTVASGAKPSKRDKRQEKSSKFVSRIEKSHKKPPKKIRRPNKKLIATLSSLIDALPNDDEDLEGRNFEINQDKSKLQSLKSCPGVMKRRAKIERDEKIRFNKNLAQIASVGQAALSVTDNPVGAEAKNADMKKSYASTTLPVDASATASKFAAIRAWASANMEMHPNFNKKSENST